MSKDTKFNRFEKIFFRINVATFGISVLIYLLYSWMIEQLGAIADQIMAVNLLSIFVVIAIFGISVIRIIKYIVKHRSEEGSSIWRSVINLFLSPLSLIIFYILIFITAATSCTYGG